MARLSKSYKHLEYDEIAKLYGIRERSLRLFYSLSNPDYVNLFTGYSDDELSKELENNLEEIEKDACFNLLAAIEAAFKLDYAIRVEEKDKDDISRKFRILFAEYQYRIPLEDVLFDVWKENPEIDRSIISQLKGVFIYRHWLAHGRYWLLKAGRKKFDFYDLYNLAIEVNELPMKKV